MILTCSKQRWEQWYVKLLHFTRNASSWPIREQLQARLLHVTHDMLTIALQCQRQRNEIAWDEHLPKFQEMLATSYDICHHAKTYRHARDPNDMDFLISPGVLPPLWLIGSSCRDPLTRRQSVELLRLHHRQCGHTDECSAVTRIEATIRLEEHNIPLARTCDDIPESSRVRVLESDLTQAGLMTLTFARSPYITAREIIEVPYHSTTPPPKRKYQLWPIATCMKLAGYQVLIRPRMSSCVCKSYGN